MRSIVISFVVYSLLLLQARAQGFTKLGTALGTNVWEMAEGILPDRMVDTDGGLGFPLYRTIWKSSDADVLICLRYPGMETFGTPYDVAIVNTNAQVVRRGRITAYQDDTPYCIAEVMTGDERLPKELRNKWLLAVGFWMNHFQTRYRLNHAEGVTNSAAEVEAELAKLPSEFYFELIHWSDSEVKPKYGAGNLYRIPNLKIRWIEVGSNVLSRAVQNPSHPYRFKMPKATIEYERKKAEQDKSSVRGKPRR